MTVISLDQAAVGSGLGAAVPPLSIVVSPGIPTAIAVESDERPLLVSMLLGGRLKPDSGHVLVDGVDDIDELRRRTALVDTPFVAEPTASVSLATVLAEEFSFAGLASGGRAIHQFLEQHRLADYEKLPVRALPAVDRVRLFSELAVLRADVDSIIITSPERHGAAASEWYGSVAAIAERGFAVAIVTDAATARALVALGARDAELPLPTIGDASEEAAPAESRTK
jgi:hypothetical protein